MLHAHHYVLSFFTGRALGHWFTSIKGCLLIHAIILLLLCMKSCVGFWKVECNFFEVIQFLFDSCLFMACAPFQLVTCRYHSESGWQTLLEVIVEHYGVEVDQSAITFFVCLIPVIIDACVKLWVCTSSNFLW